METTDQGRRPRLSDFGLTAVTYNQSVENDKFAEVIAWSFVAFIVAAIPIGLIGWAAGSMGTGVGFACALFLALVITRWAMLAGSDRWKNYDRFNEFSKAVMQYLEQNPDWDGSVEDYTDPVTRHIRR